MPGTREIGPDHQRPRRSLCPERIRVGPVAVGCSGRPGGGMAKDRYRALALGGWLESWVMGTWDGYPP